MGQGNFLLVAGAAIGLAFPVSAQTQTPAQLWQFCTDPHPEVRTIACTVIIESGQETGAALADAYSSRGTAYAVTGNTDGAIADFGRALMLDPGRVLVFGYRGSAYLAKGNNNSAIADFDRAVELEPNYVDALYGRATALRAKGDNERAIADYSRVIALDPNDQNAIAYRGIAYRARDDIDHAIADFDRLIQLHPDDAAAFNLRASAYRDKGDAARALADFDEAVRFKPDDASLRDNRGVAELMFGRFAQAGADFARAVELQPDYPYHVLWLEMARRRTSAAASGELSRNVARFDLAAWPGPILRLYLGQATAADVRASIAADTNGIARTGHACEGAFYIGELASLDGDVGAARTQLQSAVATCPHSFVEYSVAVRDLDRLR